MTAPRYLHDTELVKLAAACIEEMRRRCGSGIGIEADEAFCIADDAITDAGCAFTKDCEAREEQAAEYEALRDAYGQVEGYARYMSC